jgi:hypothetical protein
MNLLDYQFERTNRIDIKFEQLKFQYVRPHK